MSEKKTITPPGDEFQIRCPKLGHQIFFSYCRGENFGSPCFKTLDCWYPYFPVADFLKSDLSAEEWDNTFVKPPKAKVVSLVELIERAQAQLNKES